MMMVMMAFTVLVLMIMLMVAALLVLMMMVMAFPFLMIVMVMAFPFLMIVMVTFAVLVLMIVMTALALFVMVVMMAALIMLGGGVLFRLFGKAFELGSEAVALFHGGEQLFAVQLLPFGPSSFSHSVVTMVACVCPRRSATASSSFSCGSAVCERMMQLAFSTWSRKNSPKFFRYILHFLASTTVQKALSSECARASPRPKAR